MVNKIILLGNVGKDPEVKNFDNGSIASFSLATTERGYTTQNGTVVPERTDWHNIVAKGSLAKVIEAHVKKGTKLYIEGKVQYRSYDDQSGAKKYITEIIAKEMRFIGNKPEDATQSNSQSPQPTDNSNHPYVSGSPYPDESDLPY